MEKSRQIYCRWKKLSRTLTNGSRTGIERNVAFVKLNGAQDINQRVFWADFAPEQGVKSQEMHQQLYRHRWQASSHSVSGDYISGHDKHPVGAGLPAPTVSAVTTFPGMTNILGSWLASSHSVSGDYISGHDKHPVGAGLPAPTVSAVTTFPGMTNILGSWLASSHSVSGDYFSGHDKHPVGAGLPAMNPPRYS
jgi:disulfide bond formation protein DsbB